MGSSALEAKINKIRQQNEEIRRRYEEVEEDKKNAAKLNALVQMVPSTDWPERKEPPEFSNPPRAKQKPVKEKPEYVPQTHVGEGKKSHTFAQGEGPPPDPKYNFLADAEREESTVEHTRDNTGNRTYNKLSRGNFRKKNVGREGVQKDNKFYKGNHRDEHQPGYDAWRAERNRIDEDRISRQRTAEGNWRREWDNDKLHIVDDVGKSSSRPTLGDFSKKDHKDFDRKYYVNGSEHANHNRGTPRPHRGTSKSFHNYENRGHNSYEQHRHNLPLSPTTSDERTVIATDKSIKVTLNQGNITKGPVMSVKVNSPSIAGTGRVGPRQRTRVTYSHSDAEVTVPETEGFSRQKSFEDKSKGAYFNSQKSPNIKRSQSQKKERPASKSPYLQRREVVKADENTNSQKYYENDFKPNYSQSRDVQKSYSTSKSPRAVKKFTKPSRYDVNAPYLDIKEDDQLQSDNTEDNNAKKNIVEAHSIEKESAEGSVDVGPPKVESNDAESNENSSDIIKPSLPETEMCNVHENVEASVKNETDVIVEQEELQQNVAMEEAAKTELPDTNSNPESCEQIAKDDTKEDIIVATAVEPSKEDITLETSVEDVTLNTSVEDVILKTSEEDVILESSVEDVTLKTSVEDVTLKTSVEDVTLKTSEKDVILESSVEDVTLKPSVADVTLKTSEEDAILESSVEDVTLKPSVADVILKTSEEDAILESSVEDVTLKPSVEDVTLKTSKEDVILESSVEDEVLKPSVEDVTLTTSVGDVTVKTLADAVTLKSSEEDVILVSSVEDIPLKTSVEDVTLKTSKEDVILESSAEDVTLKTSEEGETLKTSEEDVQEKRDSSDTKVEQRVVLNESNNVSNESNNITNDIKNLENEEPRKDIEQSESLKQASESPEQGSELTGQASESLVNDNCDNIKDEATDVEQGSIEKPALTSEVETCTVIEAAEQLTRIDENVESKQTTRTSDAIEKSQANEESSCAKNSEDVDSCKAKSEDTINHSVASDDGSLESKVESQTKDAKQKEEKDAAKKVEGSKE